MSLQKLKIDVKDFLIKGNARTVNRSKSDTPILSISKTGGIYLPKYFGYEFRGAGNKNHIFFQMVQVGVFFYLLLSKRAKPGFVRSYRGNTIAFPKVVQDTLGVKKKTIASFNMIKVNTGLWGVTAFKLLRIAEPYDNFKEPAKPKRKYVRKAKKTVKKKTAHPAKKARLVKKAKSVDSPTLQEVLAGAPTANHF